MNYLKQSEGGFLRLSGILKLIPVGKTTWWNGVRTGRFPQPLKLGPRTTVWRTQDIQCLIDQGPYQTSFSSSSREKIQ